MRCAEQRDDLIRNYITCDYPLLQLIVAVVDVQFKTFRHDHVVNVVCSMVRMQVLGESYLGRDFIPSALDAASCVVLL